MTPMTRPRLIFRFLQLLMIPGLLMVGYHVIRFVMGNTDLLTVPDLPYSISLFIMLVVSPATVIVGLWCLRRSPNNVVGAFLVLWGIGIIDFMRSDTAPLGAGFSSLYAGIRWPALFAIIVYFPDGNVVPPRFQRWIDTLVILALIAGIISGFGQPQVPNRDIPNPLFLPISPFLFKVFEFLNSGLVVCYGFIFGLPSQIIRYWRAGRAQRQQMKWLQLFFVPFGLLFLLQTAVDLLAKPYSRLIGTVSSTVILVWLMTFPLIAVGNAILRHRLYDVDIIIRRTLIYTALSAILATIYFCAVIGTQQILKSLTGQGSEPAIVISTLLIAALFSPLRRRVQNTIDRRLYRRRFDAEKRLAQFSQSLRDEVDLETLEANLINVVQDTMQPATISLWIRQSSYEPLRKESR